MLSNIFTSIFIFRKIGAVNTELALLIEAALNIPADMLLKLQSEYNMQVTKADSSFMKRLARVRNIASVL